MGSKTTKSTSKSAPPAYLDAAYKGLVSRATDVSNTAYNPATAQQYQGLNATQNQAFGATQSAQGIQNPYLSQAADWTSQGAAPVSEGDIAQYLNPFQNDVIDATLQGIGRNNAMQQSQLTGNAALRGALGGNRVGVAQAELARNQDLNTQNILAQLNSQNYSQALGAAQADKSRAFTGAGLNAGLGQQAQGAAYTDINALLGIGGQQQQEAQRASDIGTANAQQAAQYPFNTTQWLAGITGALGPSAGGTQTSTTPGPSALSQIAGIGLTAAGIMSGNPMAMASLGTTVSGMLGGSRNLSGLATGGRVEEGATVDGKPIDPGIHSKLLNLHHATKGIGAIQKANGGTVEPQGGIGRPPAGYAYGGFPEDEDEDTPIAGADDALWGGLLQQESGNRDIQGPLVTAGANAGDRAQGPAQVMPKTAADPGFGVRPLDPNAPDSAEENRRFGRDYLNAMLQTFGGDKEAALIAYNAGPANAQKWLAAGRDYGVLPDRGQTEPYVRNIMGMASSGSPASADASPAMGAPGMGASEPKHPPAEAPRGDDWTSRINYPLLAAGLGMLASKSPHAGQAIGEGGLEGLKYMMQQRGLDRQVARLQQAAQVAQQRLGIQAESLKLRQNLGQQGLEARQASLDERNRHNKAIEDRLENRQDLRASGAMTADGHPILFDARKPGAAFDGVTGKPLKGDEPIVSPKTQGLLSDDAVNQAADYYIKSGGKMPPLGQGSVGSANRAKVMEAVTKQTTAQGGSANDIVNNAVDLTARNAGARTGGGQEAKMTIASQEITNLAPIALEKMDAIADSRGAIMPYNQLVEAFQKGTNDPKIREAALATTSLVTNYAAVMGRGSPQLTDSARQHAEDLLKTTFDKASYHAVVNLMMREANLAKQAPGQVREQNRLDHGGAPAHTAVSAPPPAVEYLKAHPDAASQFDAKYGTGAAAKVLGQ